MENILVKTAGFALHILKQYIKPGDRVVDATVGNGYDTLQLCQAVGPEGSVYGFDVQKEAITATDTLLSENGFSNYTLILDSHANLAQWISETIQATIFNLGYLPGGDHQLTTKADETKKAVSSCLALLRPNGVIAIVFYPGHPEGALEKETLLAWAKALDSSIYHCVHSDMLNQSAAAPSVLFITKKR